MHTHQQNVLTDTSFGCLNDIKSENICEHLWLNLTKLAKQE